jgi:DoxX-like family
MHSTVESVSVSKGALWSGRIVSGLVVLFMLFDSITKIMRVQQVIDATVRIGFPASTVFGIGVTLLVCTALYVIPQTSVLGAILLTAYLGGATAANVRASSPAFNTCFAITFGVLVWLGLFLRERRLRELIPLRS